MVEYQATSLKVIGLIPIRAAMFFLALLKRPSTSVSSREVIVLLLNSWCQEVDSTFIIYSLSSVVVLYMVSPCMKMAMSEIHNDTV